MNVIQHVQVGAALEISVAVNVKIYVALVLMTVNDTEVSVVVHICDESVALSIRCGREEESVVKAKMSKKRERKGEE